MRRACAAKLSAREITKKDLGRKKNDVRDEKDLGHKTEDLGRENKTSVATDKTRPRTMDLLHLFCLILFPVPNVNTNVSTCIVFFLMCLTKAVQGVR